MNEITAAIISFVVLFIVTLGALLRLVPKYVEDQLKAKEDQRKEELESERAERENRITELNARVAETNSLVSQIAKGNEINERLVNSIVDIAKEQSTNNKVVLANTNAIAGNTEAIGTLTQAVEGVKNDIDTVKSEITALRKLVEERMPPADCVDVDKQLENFQSRMIEIIEKNKTAELKPVIIADSVQTPQDKVA